MFNLTKLALLWEWVGELKNNVALLLSEVGPTGENLLPSRSTATTGQILKLTGENKTPAWADEYSYTPPAYSETEVNTGQKWIDGKDIYCKVFSGTTSAETGNEIIGNISFDNIVLMDLYLKRNNPNDPFIYLAAPTLIANYVSGNIIIPKSTTTSYLEADYVAIFCYTKPDPAPETRDDDTPEASEEVKETKTRKKTTK